MVPVDRRCRGAIRQPFLLDQCAVICRDVDALFRGIDVCFGSQADIVLGPDQVRFTPKADIA